MRNLVCGVLAFGMLLATGIAASPAAAQSAPSGDWQYREEAENCRAYRAFGEGEDRVLLQLRSFGPGSAIEAMVVSSRLPKEPFSARLVELAWDDEAWDLYQNGLLGTAGGLPTVTVLLSHGPVSAFFEGISEKRIYVVSNLDSSAETMRLRVVGSTPFVLMTGSLEQPLARLAQCETALTAKWGWGADYPQRIAKAPEMLAAESFYGVIVYPGAQLLNRIGGILQLRLKIDASGKVAECIVQSSPGSPLFGSNSCKAIRQRVRYVPGRDEQGQAVESYAQMSISFARYD